MKSSLKYIALLLMGVILINISYFTLRYDSLSLLIQYTGLFITYLYCIRHRDKFSVKETIAAAIGLRLILLFLVPNLSEDVYRFLWDGKLWLQGMDAYAWLPTEISENGILSEALFEELNSPHYYSIYPPLNQLIFIAGALFQDPLAGIITIRLFIILAEVGSLILLKKVLEIKGMDPKWITLYAFNPLVILELSGNLHFEAFVVFFVLWSLYHYNRHELSKSALGMGMAIGFKLLPLVLLASFFRKYTIGQYFRFILIALLVTVTGFLPFLFSDAVNGILNSTSLYFQNFEFNASLYFLIREIGYFIKGYNIIGTAGPILAVLSFLAMLIFNISAPSRMKLEERMLWTLTIYFLFATTVHPWYILPLLMLGVLSGYWFPLLWSFLVFFTYWGYTATGYDTKLWIVAIEYILLIVFIVSEVIIKSKRVNLNYA